MLVQNDSWLIMHGTAGRYQVCQQYYALAFPGKDSLKALPRDVRIPR